MANIIGTNGNDTLVGSYEVDTIKRQRYHHKFHWQRHSNWWKRQG
ncbi:hypothetical protein [Nostoc sp.]